MSCDVGEVTDSLENELCYISLYLWALLILQAFSHFTCITAHSDSPSFQSLHLRHSSFYNPSLALSTSQLIVQPFRCFTYITAYSPTLLLPLLRHRIFTYVTCRAAHEPHIIHWKTPHWVPKCIRKHSNTRNVHREPHKLVSLTGKLHTNRTSWKIIVSCQLKWCKEQCHWTPEQWSEKSRFTIWQSDGWIWIWRMSREYHLL